MHYILISFLFITIYIFFSNYYYYIYFFLIYIDNPYYHLKDVVPKLIKDSKLQKNGKNSNSNSTLKSSFSRVSSASSRSNDNTDIDYSNFKYIDGL